MSGGKTQKTFGKKYFLRMVTGNSDNQKRLQRKKIYVKEKGIYEVNYFAGYCEKQ
jgi:hypothetical protein